MRCWRPLRPSVGWALRQADLVFAPSRFTAGEVTRWAGVERGVTVVPHGNPPELVPPRPTPVPGRVLSVARLDPDDRYKGVDTLVRAWPRVLESQPDAELIVVGDGADRARLERLANGKRNRQPRPVHGQDRRSLNCRSCTERRPCSRCQLARRSAAAPRGEGFGLVFLEAAAAGVPVIAGRSGAVPEVVEDGQTGLLVEPGDPVAVADAICVLLKDEKLRSRMGRVSARQSRRSTSLTTPSGTGSRSILGSLASVFVPEIVSDTRVRVLLTLPSLAREYGGPVDHARALRDALRTRGVAARLVGAGAGDGEGLPVIGRVRGTPIPRSYRRIRAAIAGADIVHVLGYRDPVGTMAASVAFRARVPYLLEPCRHDASPRPIHCHQAGIRCDDRPADH